MNLIIRSAVVVIGTMMLVLALPAAANADFDNAPKGELSLWQHDSWGGQIEDRQNVDNDLRNDYCPGCDYPADTGDFNDDASSVRNRTGAWWILYEDNGLSGPRLCVAPHAYDANIGGGDDPTDFEDEISSLERFGQNKPNSCADVILRG